MNGKIAREEYTIDWSQSKVFLLRYNILWKSGPKLQEGRNHLLIGYVNIFHTVYECDTSDIQTEVYRETKQLNYYFKKIHIKQKPVK